MTTEMRVLQVAVPKTGRTHTVNGKLRLGRSAALRYATELQCNVRFTRLSRRCPERQHGGAQMLSPLAGSTAETSCLAFSLSGDAIIRIRLTKTLKSCDCLIIWYYQHAASQPMIVAHPTYIGLGISVEQLEAVNTFQKRLLVACSISARGGAAQHRQG